MALRMIGAGLGRTGTNSLKLALERLTGERCYHMIEVFRRPDDVPLWRASFEGRAPDWRSLFADFGASVDWPAAARWRELAATWPEAPILLSTRRDADEWWRSADATIFEGLRRGEATAPEEWIRMAAAMMAEFCPSGIDRSSAIAAYERHNAAVRAEAPPARLVEWRPGDGWEPLCRALDVPVPDEPFPHVNTSSEFRTRAGWD